MVGSQGGAGGSVYKPGVVHNVPGQRGGHGGTVTLMVSKDADLSGTLGSSASEKSLRLRAAVELEPGTWYLRPYVDLDVMHTYMPGYTLRGDGATLSASAMKEWTVAVSPNIEAGTRIDMGQHGWLRPFVSAGATFTNNSGLESDVTFTDGPGHGIRFTSTSSLPDTLINLGAGLQLFKEDKYEVRAEYRAQVAEDYQHQELSLRVAIPF